VSIAPLQPPFFNFYLEAHLRFSPPVVPLYDVIVWLQIYFRFEQEIAVRCFSCESYVPPQGSLLFRKTTMLPLSTTNLVFIFRLISFSNLRRASERLTVRNWSPSILLCAKHIELHKLSFPCRSNVLPPPPKGATAVSSFLSLGSRGSRPRCLSSSLPSVAGLFS